MLIIFGLLSSSSGSSSSRFEATFAERTDAIEGGLQAAETKQAEADAARRAREAARRRPARGGADPRGGARAGRAIVASCASRPRRRRRASSSTARPRSRPSGSRRSPRCAPRWAAWPPPLAGRIVGREPRRTTRARRVVDRFLADLETLEAVRTTGQTGPDDARRLGGAPAPRPSVEGRRGRHGRRRSWATSCSGWPAC